MSASRYDAIVVGAGTVGAATALALARVDHRHTQIGARAPEAFDSAAAFDLRVFALSPASVALLSRLGVWADCARRACAYRSMRVWERDAGDELRFDAGLIGETDLGWIVEDRALRAGLWAKLGSAPGIETICPATVSAVAADDKQASVDLADGRRLRAALVIAADGAWSPLRERAGIATDGASYGERAVVANVRTENPHEHTAWQRFTSDGPLAFLPLADGACSIVWSLKDARATSVLRLDDAEFCAQLTRAFDARLGTVLSTSARAAFPLRLQLAQRYAGARLALVGDAAHVVHPLAGQGLNLGLLDAAALAETVAAAATQREDPGAIAVLERYARWRQADVAVAARAFDTLDGVFRSDAPGLPWLRRKGMAWVQRLGPIKREFALHASGFAGRVPKLAQRLL
jgi:2-polyprenylphenol 6-hydroxylase